MAASLPVGRVQRHAGLVGAYAIPAALVWVALGVILNELPLNAAALGALLLYCGYYGVIELSGVLGIRAPGRRWQVPQAYGLGTSRRRRIIVWGALLGPGFATQNPFAGFAALPLAVATFHSLTVGGIVALGIGVSHGTGRALALLRDARHARQSDYLRVVLRSMQWRKIDGGALLFLVGLTVATYLGPL